MKRPPFTVRFQGSDVVTSAASSMLKPSSLVPLIARVAAHERIDRRGDEELSALQREVVAGIEVAGAELRVDDEADRRVVGVDGRDARAARRRSARGRARRRSRADRPCRRASASAERVSSSSLRVRVFRVRPSPWRARHRTCASRGRMLDSARRTQPAAASRHRSRIAECTSLSSGAARRATCRSRGDRAERARSTAGRRAVWDGA